MTEHGGDGEPRRRPARRRRRGRAAQGRPALAREGRPTSSPRTPPPGRASGASPPAPPAPRASALPSGRTNYRTLADYNAELKDLAAKNPNLVKLFTMPEKTYGGKDVLGIEITENVSRNDGKPAFFNMGVHHAREWPAGELAMEWALELVNGYKKGDARASQRGRATRATSSCRSSTPTASRPPATPARSRARAAAATRPSTTRPTSSPARRPAASTGARTAACPTTRRPATAHVGRPRRARRRPQPQLRRPLGRPGRRRPTRSTQTYRGPGPFSEPETRNIQAVVSSNQVMSLITNHTTAGLVLRAPGLAALGDPVDEDKGYKALGDAMAKENGYFTQKCFELYDTTGTTEDWSYNATGGFGFTFEIYCGAPNYETGDCDDPAFHPTYQRVVEEWDGNNPTADHANDPGPDKGYDGKGNREAYYIAAEAALNEQRHSILEGQLPPGRHAAPDARRSRPRRSRRRPDGTQEPIEFDDKLETDLRGRRERRGSSGTSTRRRGRSSPSPAARRAPARRARPRRAAAARPAPPTTRPTTARRPDPADANANNPLNYNDHPFTVPATGDNAILSISVEWATPDQRLGRHALRGHQRQRQGRGRRAVVDTSQPARPARGGLRRAARPEAGQEVRPARQQLRRPGALHGDQDLRRRRSLPGRPDRELDADLRARRPGVRHPAGRRSPAARARRSTCGRARPRPSSACAANTIGLRSVSAARRGARRPASASAASPGGRCRSTSSRSRGGAGWSASASGALRRASKAVNWNGGQAARKR